MSLFAMNSFAVPPPNPTASDANFNTAGGSSSQASLTTGRKNTSFGFSTLDSNATGYQNTAVGASALSNGVSSSGASSNNTAVGASSMMNISATYYNTAVGANSLSSLQFGDSNVAVGGAALLTSSSGSNNTAIGRDSLYYLVSGGDNISIGFSSGIYLTTESNNIYIGSEGVSGDNRTLRIGKQPLASNGLNRAFIGGINGTTLSGGGSTVLINASGQLGTVVSSARFKKDIADMGSESSNLMSLRPVTFHYISDPSQKKQYGLIAEEVAKVFPDLVVRSGTGEAESVQYHELAPMLLNELKKQHAEILMARDALALLKSQRDKDMAEMKVLRESLHTQQAILAHLQEKMDSPSWTAAR